MDPRRLARVAEAIADGSEPPSLERLLGVVVDVLSLSGAGIAIMDGGQHRGTIAVSAARFLVVDDLQFSLGEGPAVDADRHGVPIVEADLRRAVGRWPGFAAAAVEHGVLAAFAVPLRIGAVRLGVLSLYRDAALDLDAVDLADAIEIGRIATHVLIDLEGSTSPGILPGRLDEIVDHRAHVHQATGMIAAQLGSDLSNALSRLRTFAWSHDRSIDDIAADVVARRLRFAPD